MSELETLAINGRFLTQPMTGVQRYAMNVTTALGLLISSDKKNIRLLAPKGAADPNIKGVALTTVGNFNGQAWEQKDLPAAWSNQLINLCNTAPALKRNQVVCIHDVNVFEAPESYSLPFRLFYKNLQPFLARRVLTVTTVSRYSADQIAKHMSLKSSSIVVLPNGHEHVWAWNTKEAEIAPAALYKSEGRSERPFVLALGSKAKHKNLKLLYGLAEKLAELNIDLVIAGGAAEIFSEEQIRFGSNVLHLGFVTDHDLAFLFERALCLAFPSLAEGFGLPALEAMALSCPVISTDRASLPEICGDAALFAAPDQPHQWLKHIRDVMESTSLRQELIGKGREQANKFSWNNTGEGYLSTMHSKKEGVIARRQGLETGLKVAVVISTIGRPEVLNGTLQRILERQTYPIEITYVSCVVLEDAGSAVTRSDVKVLVGPVGLASQRNTALAALPNSIDIVVFFDDDFVPAPHWIEHAVRTFCMDDSIVGVTGALIADDIKGPGLSFEETDELISRDEICDVMPIVDSFSPYGCNMAFRRSAIGKLLFDERLVLYGWLEDRDFGALLASEGGRLVKCMTSRGVHMGVKSGRIAGVRLGYSQVINPLYMLKKGTISYRNAVRHIFSNILSNLIRSFLPEKYIDRRGRLRGNLLGIRDALLNRFHPERVLHIKPKEKF